MKYRKKSAVVYVEQFWPDKKPWPVGVREALCHCAELAQEGNPEYFVSTTGGILSIKPGEWTGKGGAGEQLWPMTPVYFEAIYEKALE